MKTKKRDHTGALRNGGFQHLIGAHSPGSTATGSRATTCGLAGAGAGFNALLFTVLEFLITRAQGTWHFHFALGPSTLAAGPASSPPAVKGWPVYTGPPIPTPAQTHRGHQKSCDFQPPWAGVGGSGEDERGENVRGALGAYTLGQGAH